MTSSFADLRALEAAATPGPWKMVARPEYEEARIVAYDRLERAFLDGRKLLGEQEDAALIVAARNALPGLLARVEAAEKAALALEAWLNRPDYDSHTERALRPAIESWRAALGVRGVPAGPDEGHGT